MLKFRGFVKKCFDCASFKGGTIVLRIKQKIKNWSPKIFHTCVPLSVVNE